MMFYQHFDHQERQSCIFLVNLIYLNSLWESYMQIKKGEILGLGVGGVEVFK